MKAYALGTLRGLGMKPLLKTLHTLLFLTLFLCANHPRTTLASPPQSKEVTAQAFEDIFTPRRPIPYALLGVNAFVNDRRFGTIPAQFREASSTLGLRKFRVLFHWNDGVQPTPNAQPNFQFYDQIARSIPRGTEALVILTGTPSWMKNSQNWIDNNPRKTFNELWVKKVVNRYKGQRRISAFQIWNEPNNPGFSENNTLQVLTSPENYVELLALGHSTVKSIAPTKLVINGATTAIAQNFPSTLNYNKDMVSAGALNFTDAYAIHYYGKNVDRFLLPGGVSDFLHGIPKSIWVTESGAQGINKQAEYAERIFPFLKQRVPAISRIYIYQFTEATQAATTYGLKNLTPGLSISDLYIKLRDRPKTGS